MVQSTGSQPGGRGPPEAHQVNLLLTTLYTGRWFSLKRDMRLQTVAAFTRLEGLELFLKPLK